MDECVSRPYRSADMAAVVRFATEATAARLPGLTYWNPGDIAWQFAGFPEGTDFSGFARIWEDASGEAVALAVFEPPLNFEFDVLPRVAFQAGIETEALAWAEARRREPRAADGAVPKAYAMLGEQTLSTTALDSDVKRIAFLEANGYGNVERHSVRYARRLDAEVPRPVLPVGMRLRHATDADVEARADLHRDAWSVWGPSRFSAESYRRTRANALYDETLDIVVEATEGRLMSYCICWFDQENGIGHFEPVGTRPASAGQGLGRAVVTEGLRRLRERGAHTALIGTASINAAALRTYAACGFELVDRQHYYSKVIEP